MIKQAIEKCHLTRKYENPGMEEGMCAGLRTLNGAGEPCEECKKCKLNYLNKTVEFELYMLVFKLAQELLKEGETDE